MTTPKKWNKSDYLSLALWFFPAAVVTWGLHETAHWAAGKLLGYEMWITFNQAGLAEGAYELTFHEALVGMAGPIMTWTQGVVALLMIKGKAQVRFYAFLFLAFWMRAVAMGLSYTSKPNDEASVSLLLDLPMWLLPSISVSFLFVLTYLGSKHLSVGWKGNVLSYFMASIVTASVVALDSLVF